MADCICTRFTDEDGLDVGCHLVTKEYMLEAYPGLVPWMKTPALWTWGCGSVGRLGNNSTVNQSSPVQTVSSGTNWRTISLGSNHSAAIKTDGSLWLWGCGSCGRLGDNSTTNRSSPVQTVSGGADWRSVSAGYMHSAAIKTDGSLWLWGEGSSGQLGTNSTLDRSSPVQTVSSGYTWRSVSAGNVHSAAIKTDGSLWLWGLGVFGQLGNNCTCNQSSPVQTVSSGYTWRNVSAGSSHSAAIKTDGSLWLWGRGTFSALGNNCTDSQSSPVQTVSGGTNWRSVSVSGAHSAAIKTDGTLWLWGQGALSELGNNCLDNQSSPVQTVSGGTNWRSVSARGNHTAAIKTDGTLWLWGLGSSGHLGNNCTLNQSSPVQTVSGGTNWRMASAGFHTAAIRDEGDY